MERTHRFRSAAHRPEFLVDRMTDDPRPGLEMDYKDSADSLEKERVRQRQEDLCNSIFGEYGDHNSRFWWFMFAVLAVSVLFFMSIPYSKRDKFEKRPELAPSNEVLIIGFILFYFVTGFTAYHHYKNINGRDFRYSTLFCLIIVWGFTLWWSVLFYPQNSTRDASVVLIWAILFLIIWIGLSLRKGKCDYLLILALIWLTYIFYFTIESDEQHHCSVKKKFGEIFDCLF